MDPLQELKERFDTIVRKLQETLVEAKSPRDEIEHEGPPALKLPQPKDEDNQPR